MVKPGSIRQKEYEPRQRGIFEKAKGAKKRKQRAAIKANKQKYEAYKAKDRMRKRAVATPSSSSPLNSSYTTQLFHALQKACQEPHLRKYKSFHNLHHPFHPTVRAKYLQSLKEELELVWDDHQILQKRGTV